MNVQNIRTIARAAFRNAVVWGAGWSAAAIVVITTMRTLGMLPGKFSWLVAIGIPIKFGVIGFIAGGAFSAVIRLLYHGERLSQINWIRFGLLGGAVTAVFVPLFLQTMNLLSGDGLVPWSLVLDDGVITGLFGGAAAAVSMKLAQRGETVPLRETTPTLGSMAASTPITSGSFRTKIVRPARYDIDAVAERR